MGLIEAGFGLATAVFVLLELKDGVLFARDMLNPAGSHSAGPVEFWAREQRTTWFNNELAMLDCNDPDPVKKAVMVGIKDDKSMFHHALQDIDGIKCVRFNEHESLRFRYGEIQPINGEDDWTTCESRKVMVALFSRSDYFSDITNVTCALPSRGYEVGDQCETVLLEPPYSQYLGDPAAEDTWPIQCPGLPDLVGITAILYHHQDLLSSTPNLRGIKCCKINPVEN